MGRHKKKFINKENAVKFYLVHRSQRDPLFLDENAGERVLLPAEPIKSKKLAELFREPEKREETEEEIEKRKAEERKYGIYFDDGYNYLQHLREIKSEIDVEPEEYVENDKIEIEPKNKPKIMLPSSVFASEYEEEVGYFNMGAPNSDPKIGWDSEIVETLDEETNYDFENPNNQLDDDFFIKANDEKLVVINENENDSEEESGEEEDDDDDDDDDDEYNGSEPDNNYDYDNESLNKFETKSHFTNYSMTSSVIRRNEKLKYLDEHFERLYSQYTEDQIGSLDIESEDITGYRNVDNIVIKQALEHFQKSTKKGEYIVEKDSNRLEKLEEEDDDSDEDTDEETETETEDEYEYIYVKEKIEDPIDCESVLSLKSSNGIKPNLIREENLKIRLCKKTGLPLNVLKEKPVSKNQLEKLDYKITRVLPIVPERNKNESKEEKKARKHAVKEYRKNRRQEKKINKLMFKEEKCRQSKQINDISKNIVQIKLS